MADKQRNKLYYLVGAVVVVALIIVAYFLFFNKKAGVNSKDVIVRVGDEVLTKSDLQAMIPPSYAGQIDPRQVINAWLQTELLYKDAIKNGIMTDSLKKALKDIEKQYVVRLYLQKLMANIAVTDQEIQDYFTKHKDNFLSEIKISRIVVSDPAVAQQVYNQLRAGGDFQKLASQYSIEQNKGQITPYFGMGNLDPSLEEVLFSMQSGEYTEPMSTGDGISIIKVVDKRRVKKDVSLDFVRPYIRQILQLQKTQTRLQVLVDSLKKVYKVQEPAL